MNWRTASMLFICTCLAVAAISAVTLRSYQDDDLAEWMAGVDGTVRASAQPIPARQQREPVRFDPALPSPFADGGSRSSASPGGRP